ncbi:U4/U6-U5 snRNP complex subunit lsm8 [Trebouxia sp. C0010 RCD-2024]
MTVTPRTLQGLLKGYDQATNLILDECHERVYSTKVGVEKLALGLYVIRGDNIAVVGEVDEEMDSSIDFATIRSHPLGVISH